MKFTFFPPANRAWQGSLPGFWTSGNSPDVQDQEYCWRRLSFICQASTNIVIIYFYRIIFTVSEVWTLPQHVGVASPELLLPLDKLSLPGTFYMFGELKVSKIQNGLPHPTFGSAKNISSPVLQTQPKQYLAPGWKGGPLTCLLWWWNIKITTC